MQIFLKTITKRLLLYIDLRYKFQDNTMGGALHVQRHCHSRDFLYKIFDFLFKSFFCWLLKKILSKTSFSIKNRKIQI